MVDKQTERRRRWIAKEQQQMRNDDFAEYVSCRRKLRWMWFWFTLWAAAFVGLLLLPPAEAADCTPEGFTQAEHALSLEGFPKVWDSPNEHGYGSNVLTAR